MAYKILLPSKMMKDLWRLREYCAAPPIIQQVRKAVGQYLKQKETEIGTTIEDAGKAIKEHREIEATERYRKERIDQ